MEGRYIGGAVWRRVNTVRPIIYKKEQDVNEETHKGVAQRERMRSMQRPQPQRRQQAATHNRAAPQWFVCVCLLCVCMYATIVAARIGTPLLTRRRRVS
jgi:Flp pilus assembly protein TadB